MVLGMLCDFRIMFSFCNNLMICYGLKEITGNGETKYSERILSDHNAVLWIVSSVSQIHISPNIFNFAGLLSAYKEFRIKTASTYLKFFFFRYSRNILGQAWEQPALYGLMDGWCNRQSLGNCYLESRVLIPVAFLIFTYVQIGRVESMNQPLFPTAIG